MSVTSDPTGRAASDVDVPVPGDTVAGDPVPGHPVRDEPDETDPADRPPDRRRWAEWAGLAVFSAGAVTAVAWLTVLTRGTTFFYDDWSFVQTRDRGFWSVDLSSHNGHPVMLPYAVYRLLFAVAGLDHFWPYRLVLIAINVTAGWFLFVLARRKVHPVVAAAAACVLMLFGPGWGDLTWPFQIGFLGTMAAGLAALIELDRRRVRADIAACICLVVAAMCSGVVVAFLAGVAVELCWRRVDWRRLWVPAIPAVLFGVWYEARGRQHNTPIHAGLVTMLGDVGRSASLAMAGLVGRGWRVGDVLALLVAAVVVAAVIRSPARSCRLAMAVTAALTFWAVTAYDRGQVNVGTTRYAYPAAVFVVLALVELPGLLGRPSAAGAGRHRRSSATLPGDVVAGAVVVYAALAIFWNAGLMTAGAGALVADAAIARAELAAVQLAGPALAPGFQPDRVIMPQVRVGPYRAAVAAWGSPADPPASLRTLPPPERTDVDDVLLRGLPMHLVAVPAADAPVGRCPTAVVAGTDQTPLPSSGVWIITGTAPASIGVRAYSPAFSPVPQGTIGPAQTVRLTWSGAGRVPVTWTVGVAASAHVQFRCR